MNDSEHISKRSASGCGLKRLQLVAGTLAVISLISVAAVYLAARSLGPLPLQKATDLSTIVLDRDERLLRAFTTREDRWRLPVAVDKVDPTYLKLLLAYEDKRFYQHPGIDPLAGMRALWQLLRSGRVISGASTLTMQVARLLEPRDKRTLKAKFRQSVRALQLEARFSKDEILALYLRLAPMGGNLEGVRAASLAYFGREPRHLSLAEAALLVALPQSPEARRPDKRRQLARKARDRVLQRALLAGAIKSADARAAMRRKVPGKRHPFPKLAPHLAKAEVDAFPQRRIHRLTIDKGLQQRFEDLARSHAHRLGDKHSVAIFAIDHHTGEVLARIGSPDFLEDRFHGPIDMTQAVRSPGSALKPFVYGLAFEDGLAHPETLIDDTPTRFGRYKPKNFDESWRGMLPVRKSLQLSLNVPAVKLLDKVGPSRLFARFRQTGLQLHTPVGAKPNLSMVLGGLGITVSDLAKAYAGLARGGQMIDLVWRKRENQPAPTGKHILSPQAAWHVADILAGAPPPQHARRGEIAYKTGTSYGYRDAWAAGFDGKTTITVWAGRPDGTASPGLTGRTAAAPILFDAFKRLGRPLERLPGPPDGTLRVSSNGDLPRVLRHFERLDTPDDQRRSLYPKVKIAFPPDGAQLALSLSDTTRQSISFEDLLLKAEGGKLPLIWMVNGRPIDANKARRRTFWQPSEPGFVKLSVLDALGRADSVLVRVE